MEKYWCERVTCAQLYASASPTDLVVVSTYARYAADGSLRGRVPAAECRAPLRKRCAPLRRKNHITHQQQIFERGHGNAPAGRRDRARRRETHARINVAVNASP